MSVLRTALLMLIALGLARPCVAWAVANPAPDRLTVAGSTVVLGWEPRAFNPGMGVELEWVLQRKDLKVLIWGVEGGGFADLSYGSGGHVTTAVARHWHTWRGLYVGVRGGVGLQALSPGTKVSEIPGQDTTSWDLIARVPLGVEVGWQHPARGWRAGLRAEQVLWAPYTWKLNTRLGVQSSLGLVVSVPLFWKRTVVR